MAGMRSGWHRGLDGLAAAAVLIIVAVTVAYVALFGQQGDMGDSPALWFLAGMVVATLLGAYGAARAAPRRGVALVASGTILVPWGILGIFSIGLPLLAAGVIALVAAARSRRIPTRAW